MNYISKANNQFVCEGDTCVIYVSEHKKYILKIESNAQLQTKFGLIKALDLLNHPYGLKYECERGWILPLRLTPELWTQLLPHRTQILYQTDISMILLQLDIKPGSLVVESGTGSGSLSHSILRACLPHGFLYTYDINESRVNDARKEFEDHGFSNNVRVTNKNICQEGFDDDLVGKIDAVILDLPETWEAIEHANKVLTPDGSRLCTFSPCIEQVQQNVTKMKLLKFKDITTLECLIRPFDVKTRPLSLWDNDVLEGLTTINQKRIENIASNINFPKRVKVSSKTSNTNQAESTTTRIKRDSPNDDLQMLNIALSDPKANFASHMLPKKSYLYPKQYNETVGHSGYLTFASKRV